MGEFIMPARVPEFRVSGIAFVDDLGDGNHLFAMYANENGRKIIRYKAVLAAPTIYTNMQQIMTHLGYRCCGGIRLRIGMN